MLKRILYAAALVPAAWALLSSCAMMGGHPNTDGWKNVFKTDFSNAVYNEGSWEIEAGGVMVAQKDEMFWTKERYGDFVLDLECKYDEDANSGVLLRTDDLVDWIQTGIEVQVRDSHEQAERNKYESGSIFDIIEPSLNAAKRVGEWNRFTITCRGKNIKVILNGKKVVDMDLNDWTEPNKNPDGTKNKFRTAYKDMPLEGHIGFQGKHGGATVWYRNIKIRELK